ncbi:hypothetical protein FRX31_015568 [Thalictrum thalictroides]|uniref:Uncharacterized protein n=1 Tax=Thalictrum thalictroides TaxID=46969 RepID=A0A7J6WD72_THATH|nr:hypothetical protein FRX31_015568 [Thalictrum thalictroides]
MSRWIPWRIIAVQSAMERNISVLRDHGVPEDNISKYVLRRSNKLWVNSVQFNKMTLETDKFTWDMKVTIYRSYGWSEDGFISMFKKQPNIVGHSAKKLNSKTGLLPEQPEVDSS